MPQPTARRLVLCGLATLLCAHAAAAQSLPPTLVLTGANVIDGVSARPLVDATVVVRDGRIASVSQTRGPAPAGARVIDLGGRWLLPGLVDAHAHLRDLASARSALRSGVTTARSLGGAHFADLSARDLHRAGAADLPDVVGAGYHVRRRLADEIFLDIPTLRALRAGVGGPEDVRRVVHALIARGADVIKVMVTERAGMTDTDPLRRVLSDAELAAAVDEATRAGRMVAAHAHTDAGARAAVLAGVRTVEHGTLVSDTTLRLMKERGACLVPTLSFWLDMLDPGGDYDDPALATRARVMLPQARSAVARAHEIGVVVAAGSDMRYASEQHRTVVDEVEALVESGVPAMAAIQAATSSAARCLGIAERTGALTVGREADLLVVTGNPLEDLRRLRQPVMIVNDGRIAVDNLARSDPGKR